MLYAPTTQAVTPAHVDPAREIRDRLGPHRAEAFGLSHQNCASGMAAVDVAGELLRAEGRPGDCALVVTGEQAFSPKIQLIEDVAIMGDAAAACPVTLDGAGDAVRSYVTSSMGEFSAVMLLEEERSPRFSEVYAPELAKVMRRAVAAAGLGGAGSVPKGLRRLGPSVSTPIWERVSFATRIWSTTLGRFWPLHRPSPMRPESN